MGMSSSDSNLARRSEAFRAWLLGGFRVSVGSRAIAQDAWHLKKAAVLVKLLALAPGHRLHREQAMDILWPGSGSRVASNSLRSTLHAARKVLDQDAGSRYLASDKESLVLCPEGELWVDVDAFEGAAARRGKDPAAYRAAIELYAGELLPEDRYEGWVENRREGLRQLYLALLFEVARVYEENGEYERGIEALRRVVAEETTLEEAHAALMRLQAISGRPEMALAQYERLRDTLSRGLGTRPAASSRRLRDEIATGVFAPPIPSLTSAPREGSLDAKKHNLPAPRTSFVGREREMIEVKRLLAMTRLLTLTGAGGSGKTRLALEVARDLVSSYPDRVWLVELAGLSKGDLVPQAVATALKVPERPGQALTDALVEALSDKELLLVLDNCEHLVDEVAQLVDMLLDSCPHLRVLATSREPLGIPGEVNRVVPLLSLPSRADEEFNEASTVDSLMGYEAMRLFVDRARLRLPDFELISMLR